MRNRLKKCEIIVFPILLILYALIGFNQGADLTDTTYSLSNYQFFHEMTGGWKYATYLANGLGSILMAVTGGKMIWMNIVTRLLVALLAGLVFFALRKKIPMWIIFLGEGIAISLCWCPTVILYNYLSYALLTVAAIILVYGLIQSKKSFLLFAGVLLGINVFVRVSNLTQIALVFVVWYDAFLQSDTKLRVKKLWQSTLFCVAGYAIGCLMIFGMMLLFEGSEGYVSMINWLYGMFTSSDSNGGYSMGEMLKTIMENYLGNMKWILFLFGGTLAGGIMFSVFKEKLRVPKMVVFSGGIAVLFLFFYRNGMFTSNYYSVGSIFCLSVVFVLLSYFILLITLFRKKEETETKLLALCALIILCITPLGSNNHVYTNINNLFFVAPVSIYCMVRLILLLKNRETKYPVWMMGGAFLLLLLVQLFLFHQSFVFHDSLEGESRNTVIAGTSVMNGMKTNEEHARAIEEFAAYLTTRDIENQTAVFYGNIPGAQYLMGIPCALTSTWPDLDSFSVDQFTEEMETLGQSGSLPLLVLSPEVAAYVTEDAEGMSYLEVDVATLGAEEKLQEISRFIKENQYAEVFGNDEFVILEGRTEETND